MDSDYDETIDQRSNASSDADDEEPSLIEYARYYGLSKDYTALYPLSSYVTHSIAFWECPDLEANQLPPFKLPDTIDLEEKWTIDLQSAVFLKQVASLDVAPFPEILRQRNTSLDHKVEPLLLSTDPELEQRRFIRARNLRRNKASQEVSSEALWQDDQAAPLYWPEPGLPATLIEEIKKEKLQLDKNDILFLQQCISMPEEPEAQELGVPPYKKARQEYEAARHTSPLLPCSSPFQFSVPDSPISRMPLATSPVDPVPAEIARITDAMDVDDDFSLDGLSDISAFDIEAVSDNHFKSPLKRKRPEDYKVELPLSPALGSSSPLKRMKTLTFSDELCTAIPDYAKAFPSGDTNDTYGISNFLEQVIMPGAQSAMLAINGEQLIQAESILRVDVPAVDATSPLPPWEVFACKPWGNQTELEAQQGLVSMLKREFIRSREHWPDVGTVDRAISRWRPFDMQLSDLPEEDIGCDHLDKFGPEEPQDTTSGWKLDGLRVLDPCEDDDEEMEAVEIPLMLGSLNLTDDVLDRTALSTTDVHESATTPQPRSSFFALPKTTASRLIPLPSHGTSMATQPLASSTFSASNTLERFMQIHTGQKTNAKPQTHTLPKHVDKPAGKPVAHTEKENDASKATSSTPIHLPSLPTPMPLRTFVLSSTMFARRNLMKEISRLSCMTEYIERDFTSARALRSTSSLTSEADEADLILAPGHGLMLTTLQRLMQKSLPYQVTRNVVRERVVQLARRYERLIIMVHEEQNSNQERPLDNRECGELASLINFCAAQNHEIQVMYIPGDESALATWIVASMVRYGLDDPDVQLLQDESSWELFLRKAGMDAFAAQVVLKKLNAPESMPTCSTEQRYGLPGFVMMDEAERLKRFGALFGGEKILRKVSMAIDGSWTRDVVAGDLNGRKL
ncbi:hypothetical protein KCU62_g518, partial [Aureobasidium sp. EXF-3399]